MGSRWYSRFKLVQFSIHGPESRKWTRKNVNLTILILRVLLCRYKFCQIYFPARSRPIAVQTSRHISPGETERYLVLHDQPLVGLKVGQTELVQDLSGVPLALLTSTPVIIKCTCSPQLFACSCVKKSNNGEYSTYWKARGLFS